MDLEKKIIKIKEKKALLHWAGPQKPGV